MPGATSFGPSHRRPVLGAQALGPVADDTVLTVTVVLRPQIDPRDTARPAARGMSRADYAASPHAADPASVAAVRTFAAQQGLEAFDYRPGPRSIRLRGTATRVATAFGTELTRYRKDDHTFVGRQGALRIPDQLARHIVGVFGLDTRRQVRPHVGAVADDTAAVGLSVAEVASWYGFPTSAQGRGQTVGIVTLGGGYDPSVLQAFFAGRTMPEVTWVGVDGATNWPVGHAGGDDDEIHLDLEVLGTVAPAARIVVYFGVNTDAGFINAIAAAIHDEKNRPTVVSISWGAAEALWTAQAMDACDLLFADAARLGVTVCTSVGDRGGANGQTDGHAHVDFPASSPHVLACGGTHLTPDPDGSGTESVWNSAVDGATGGGISEHFARPAWQAAHPVPPSLNPGGFVGRGLPDVAGHAAGYSVLLEQGVPAVLTGTSAVAPLWAGLVALLSEHLGRPVGALNELLYSPAGAGALRDIVAGDNRWAGGPGYSAGPGWDACTGLGTPDGAKLLACLEAHLGGTGPGAPPGARPPVFP